MQLDENSSMKQQSSDLVMAISEISDPETVIDDRKQCDRAREIAGIFSNADGDSSHKRKVNNSELLATENETDHCADLRKLDLGYFYEQAWNTNR